MSIVDSQSRSTIQLPINCLLTGDGTGVAPLLSSLSVQDVIPVIARLQVRMAAIIHTIFLIFLKWFCGCKVTKSKTKKKEILVFFFRVPAYDKP
jgi:hypothetical protein